MSFENNLEQAQQERCGLTGEEVRDVQALWRSVVSEELPQLPEGVDDDTLRTILWKNIRKEFLDALAGVGFERDQKLEMRVQEGSITAEERVERQKQLVRRYAKLMSITPGGWGFTPLLARSKDKDIGGLDCAGAAIGLGAVLQECGVEVEKGEVPGHSMVIAKIGDELWYVDGRSNKVGVISSPGQQQKAVVLHRLTDEDQERLNIPYRLLRRMPLEAGSLEMIFGNLSQLNRIAHGMEREMTSSDIAAAASIYNTNREILDRRNWLDIRDKLFPEIAESERECEKEWNIESDRTKDALVLGHEREDELRIFTETVNQAAERLGHQTPEAKSALNREIIDLPLQQRESILRFMSGDGPILSQIPEPIQKYFSIVKNELDHVGESRPDIRKHILKQLAGGLGIRS